MSKGLYRALFSLLLALCCLPGAVLPAYAAPARVKTVAARTALAGHAHRWKGRGVRHPRFWGPGSYHGGPGSSEINQYFRGNTDYNHHYYIVGVHGQGNSGNDGVNRGHNQDNSTNGGNQMIISGRPIRYRRVNQYYAGDSHFNRWSTRIGGYDQVNTGNDGVNHGLNQDNSSNGGNQIVG